MVKVSDQFDHQGDRKRNAAVMALIPSFVRIWVLLCFSVNLCSLFSDWLICMLWLATNPRGLFKRLLSRGGRRE